MENRKHTKKGRGGYLCALSVKRPKRCMDCKKVLKGRAKKGTLRCSRCSDINANKNFRNKMKSKKENGI